MQRESSSDCRVGVGDRTYTMKQSYLPLYPLVFTSLPLLNCTVLYSSDTFWLFFLSLFCSHFSKSLLLHSSASCSSGKRSKFSWLDFCRLEFNANAAWGQNGGERCINAVFTARHMRKGGVKRMPMKVVKNFNDSNAEQEGANYSWNLSASCTQNCCLPISLLCGTNWVYQIHFANQNKT